MRYGKMNNDIISSDYIELINDKVAKKWGEKYYYEWGKHYIKSMNVAKNVLKSSLMASIVEFYCGHSHIHINKYLRFGIDESKIYEEMSHILIITLSTAPRVPNNIIVYRLVCDEFIHELIKRNKKGLPTQEKGFISTSLTKDIIKNSNEPYSDHKNMLKIYVKSNTVGIYVNVIAERNENELLLCPNGYFRLLKSPYEESGKIIYECELIYFFMDML
ncbi:hypothetical protein FDA48_05880 [Clostridium botulinum]|nr:hypothetical protein [Clostridium botulinum]